MVNSLCNPLSKIGLGTVKFGMPYGINNGAEETSESEVASILLYAKSLGIDTLDTAYAYGKSEKVLGCNDLAAFKVVSKFALKHNHSIAEQLKHSLQALNIDKLYGYLAHRPDELARDPAQWDLLNGLKNAGYIQKIGFSFSQMREVEAVLAQGMVPDLIQVPYNYLDNRFEQTMINLKKNGCEVHIRSAFLQGLFFSDTHSLNPYFDEVKPILIQQQQFGKELPGMLLKFCTDKHFIDKVIFGVNNLEQLQGNISSVSTSRSLPLMDLNISEAILNPSKWPR